MTLFKVLYARPKRTLATTKVEQPPPQKRRKKNKKITNTHPPPPLSFTSLPVEIILNCLARIPKSHYPLLSLVSKTIRSLLSSPELYTVRSQIGNTEPCLYICQELPINYDRWYTALDQTLQTLITYNEGIKDEFSLSPIITPTTSASPPPKNSTFLAVGFEIYQMGGTIHGEEQPSSAVRVLDCRTHTWRDAPDMTVARKRAESAYIDGKIFVVGGTKGSKNRAEVFDLKSQTWKSLLSPSDGDAEFQLYRGEIYATSKHKNYAYDSKQEIWKELVEFDIGPELDTNGPCCVIENVKFGVFEGRVKWYDSERRNWFDVDGLDHQYVKCARVQLANHGGKIVLLCDEPSFEPTFVRRRNLGCSCCSRRRQKEENRRIWCVVIKLEKRVGFSKLKIRGKVVLKKFVLTFPKSFKFLSCMVNL